MPDINWEIVGTIYCIVAFFVWMDSVDFDGMLVAATKGILTVYNVLGEVVATRSLAGDEPSVQLDLAGQPSGQYYITIRREDGKMAKASFIIHR